MRGEAEKVKFLDDDLYDTLRWMFVSAITWEASPKKGCPNLDV
jgi:hypothetical protein